MLSIGKDPACQVHDNYLSCGANPHLYERFRFWRPMSSENCVASSSAAVLGAQNVTSFLDLQRTVRCQTYSELPPHLGFPLPIPLSLMQSSGIVRWLVALVLLVAAAPLPAQRPTPPDAPTRVTDAGPTRSPDGWPGPGYWQQRVDFALEAAGEPPPSRGRGAGAVSLSRLIARTATVQEARSRASSMAWGRSTSAKYSAGYR